MGKGFLSALLRKLVGAPWSAPATTPATAPVLPPEETLILGEAWENEAWLRLDGVLKNLKTVLDATPKNALGATPLPHYFMTLSRLQRQMVKGSLPFAYPKAGTYNYPETDMFFAEHCYVPVTALAGLAKKMKNEGNGFIANIFIKAVRAAMAQAEPLSKDALPGAGYNYEDGQTSPHKFFLSVYEEGGSFASVLRLNKPAAKAPRPWEGNGPL